MAYLEAPHPINDEGSIGITYTLDGDIVNITEMKDLYPSGITHVWTQQEMLSLPADSYNDILHWILEHDEGADGEFDFDEDDAYDSEEGDMD